MDKIDKLERLERKVKTSITKNFYFWWEYYKDKYGKEITNHYIKDIILAGDYRSITLTAGNPFGNFDTFKVTIDDVKFYIKEKYGIDILQNYNTGNRQYNSVMVKDNNDITKSFVGNTIYISNKEVSELISVITVISRLDSKIEKKYSMNFNTMRHTVKGNLGEMLVKKVITECIDKYKIKTALKDNSLSIKHGVDFVLENVDTYEKPVEFSFLEVKSHKHMNGYSYIDGSYTPVLHTGISLKLFNRYKEVNDSGKRVLIVFVDHCGFPTPATAIDSDGHYTDFKKENKGMIYGIWFDEFLKESEVSFRNKNSEIAKEKRKLRINSKKIKYPHEPDGKSVVVVDLKRMKELTFLLEEVFDFRGIDYNYNYIPEDINDVITSLSTTNYRPKK